MKQLGDYIQDNSEVKFTPPDFGISILGSSHGKIYYFFFTCLTIGFLLYQNKMKIY